MNEVWSETDETDISDNEDDVPPEEFQGFDESQDRSANALVGWLVRFLFLLQARFHITDRVTNHLFQFMKVFLAVLGRLYSACSGLRKLFPATLYQAQKKYHNLHLMKFSRYVVCKRCHRIYHLSECIDGRGSNQHGKTCSHRLFRSSRSRICGEVLVKTVELAMRTKIFYPLMTYCYIDLRTSLQQLLNSDFVNACEQWRTRSIPEGVLADVYDGDIWNDFLCYGNKPFLQQPFSFAFMINLDWFQPYKHLTYSVGAIYLTVFNLPRSMRYKLQNVCLLGLLPGPDEPKLTVNSYIDPLVDELVEFWDGVELSVSRYCERKIVQCAVICASCDLPAGRKLCGFLSYSARLGCSRCKRISRWDWQQRLFWL